MDGIRIVILMLALAYGIYASHHAADVIKDLPERSQAEIGKSTFLWKDTLFMRQAIDLGHQAQNEEENAFGSIIIKGYRIVGKGWNKCNENLDPSAHAEVEAIRDACQKLGNLSLEGCTIYTTAQPCPMCLSLLYAVKIDKIYYGLPSSWVSRKRGDVTDETIYENLTKDQHVRLIPEVTLLREEAIVSPAGKR